MKKLPLKTAGESLAATESELRAGRGTRAGRAPAVGPLVLVILAIALTGCHSQKTSDRLREAYCSDLESSPVYIDAPLGSAGRTLQELGRLEEDMRTSLEHGPIRENQIWLLGAHCQQIATSLHEGVAGAAQFSRIWRDVAIATDGRQIDPPEVSFSNADLDVCGVGLLGAMDLAQGPADATNQAKVVRGLREARAKVENRLAQERAKWSAKREKELGACEAAGYKRAKPPGFYEKGIWSPGDAGSP